MEQQLKNVSLEKVIEHHLSQNMGQKITPHLVAGMALLLGQHIRKLSIPGVPAQQAEGVPQHD